ncbi:hypothetical protein IWZ03DRAFT_127928 [Phyllosticta citriasiana]|uniref:Uncharacterized protein n=1 Tax=Phyllosticta citriasiana TaxID=595635 RepID=A0ABR1KVW7_9PEZI
MALEWGRVAQSFCCSLSVCRFEPLSATRTNNAPYRHRNNKVQNHIERERRSMLSVFAELERLFSSSRSLLEKPCDRHLPLPACWAGCRMKSGLQFGRSVPFFDKSSRRLSNTGVELQVCWCWGATCLKKRGQAFFTTATEGQAVVREQVLVFYFSTLARRQP